MGMSSLYTLNVHTMVHVADEVEEFGCLDACSSYPFEIYMPKIKGLFEQEIIQLPIAKRLSELPGSFVPINIPVIRISKPDSVYILSESCCCEVIAETGSVNESGEKLYASRVYEKTEPVFSTE